MCMFSILQGEETLYDNKVYGKKNPLWSLTVADPGEFLFQKLTSWLQGSVCWSVSQSRFYPQTSVRTKGWRCWLSTGVFWEVYMLRFTRTGSNRKKLNQELKHPPLCLSPTLYTTTLAVVFWQRAHDHPPYQAEIVWVTEPVLSLEQSTTSHTQSSWKLTCSQRLFVLKHLLHTYAVTIRHPIERRYINISSY